MTQVRPTTLVEIKRILDDSYFTSQSFTVKNVPNGSPFLIIEFTPLPALKYKVYELQDGEFLTEESPGMHLFSGQERTHKSFAAVLSSISPWLARIREDLAVRKVETGEIDEFLEQFRAQMFADSGDDNEEFSAAEVQELREKLDALQAFIETQAERINATELQIKQFEQEIAGIKGDLETMPKGVWRKVAGNKLLKSVKDFLGTSEGRSLIADGLKKLIGLE